ncbi:MAG: TIGR00341 family protein [Saprospiraceae bacterium]|nr:TIGR00341 family protein [Saprospiraceae bacterium]
METPSPRVLFRASRLFLRDRFNLDEDKAHEADTIDEIKRSMVFRGTNLWILIFAIMVASVGLNVNSTAVIIGAMLISPLMGPIMGVGLGIGINDFDLILKALKNLGVAVAISIITSALYFAISPLNDAQSELLARTSPTLWDVLIAFFGGLAGIVAGSRKEKSNAIPGVAIATALMPPLCTAGYAIATAKWNFFFGAMYLFFINGVFISLATYIIVRFLGFKLKEFESPDREKKVKRYILVFVILFIIPSAITAYRVVQQSLFNQRVSNFLNMEMVFDDCKMIDYTTEYTGDHNKIEVTLYGEHIEDQKILELEEKLPKYGLDDAYLVVNQGYAGENIDIQEVNENIKTGIIEDLYRNNAEQLKSKEEEIAFLKKEIISLKSIESKSGDITGELKALMPDLEQFSLSETVVMQADSMSRDTVLMAYMDFKKKPSSKDLKKIETFLKARTKKDNIKILVE